MTVCQCRGMCEEGGGPKTYQTAERQYCKGGELRPGPRPPADDRSLGWPVQGATGGGSEL